MRTIFRFRNVTQVIDSTRLVFPVAGIILPGAVSGPICVPVQVMRRGKAVPVCHRLCHRAVHVWQRVVLGLQQLHVSVGAFGGVTGPGFMGKRLLTNWKYR
ncbi:MAG: hypothetical protein JWQ08_1746, partial [Deinococcus sp.]|nr:hypothetical protein [Deinococcus sp.]